MNGGSLMVKELGKTGLILTLLICASPSWANSIEISIPAACSDDPTPDCLVDAFYVSPLPRGYILADGATVFGRIGRLDIAARLATSAEQFAGSDELLEENIAEAWHAAGREDKAQAHLLQALALIAKRQQVVLPIYDAYVGIAQTEVTWGHPEKVEAVLARMKDDAGAELSPMWRAYAEARMWLLADRTDQALASILRGPDENRYELLSRMGTHLRCDGGSEAQCVKVAESIKSLPDSMRVFGFVASRASGTPGAPERILAEALLFLRKSPDFTWHAYEQHFGDSLAELAKAWTELGQPEKALEILSLRSSDPRLIPPSGPVPIEESAIRAVALGLLDRRDAALEVADAAARAFAALPEGDPVRNHILWESTHGRWHLVVGRGFDIRGQIEADMAKASALRNHREDKPSQPTKKTDRIPILDSEIQPRLKALRQEARDGHGSEVLHRVIASQRGVPLQESILVIAEGLAEAK